MAYTGPVATRPPEIHGSLQAFNETTAPAILVRTQMDDGQTIKARRRATRAIRQGEASVTVRASEIPFWREWYDSRCQNGSLPTRLRFPPDCAEQIWRFSTPPSFQWVTKDVVRISFSLEKLPQWED